MNIWDILILLAVGAMLFLALRAMRRGKAGGCHDCGGGCACCGQSCAGRQTQPAAGSDRQPKTTQEEHT